MRQVKGWGGMQTAPAVTACAAGLTARVSGQECKPDAENKRDSKAKHEPFARREVHRLFNFSTAQDTPTSVPTTPKVSMGAKPNSQAMTNSTNAPLMMPLTASNIPAA